VGGVHQDDAGLGHIADQTLQSTFRSGCADSVLDLGRSFAFLPLLFDLLPGHLEFVDVLPFLIERVGQRKDEHRDADANSEAERHRSDRPEQLGRPCPSKRGHRFQLVPQVEPDDYADDEEFGDRGEQADQGSWIGGSLDGGGRIDGVPSELKGLRTECRTPDGDACGDSSHSDSGQDGQHHDGRVDDIRIQIGDEDLGVGQGAELAGGARFDLPLEPLIQAGRQQGQTHKQGDQRGGGPHVLALRDLPLLAGLAQLSGGRLFCSFGSGLIGHVRDCLRVVDDEPSKKRAASRGVNHPESTILLQR
jgi:hypothetical protein